jgi:hypothetical protein
VVDGSERSAASQADGYMLIRVKARAASESGYAADDQPAVIAPSECDPLGILTALVAESRGGLERLIVVDPEYATRKRRALRDEAVVLRREIRGACMTKGPVGLGTFQIGCAHIAGDSIQLRVMPGDRECDRRIQQRAGSICVVRVFPEIVRRRSAGTCQLLGENRR